MTGDPRLAITERELQKQVRAFAEGMGWRVAVAWTSIHSPRGFPDLFCVRHGVVVAIELKSERGKTTPYQDAWLADLALVPGVVWCGVLRPSGWYAKVLDEVLR